jgi:hypothetical protein
MASTKYTYSISGDTANGVLNSTDLKAEIAASAIVTALDYITSTGNVLDIWMKAALSGGDETLLGNVVAAHQGAADNSNPMAEDGALKVSPDLLPVGQYLYQTSRADEYYRGVWNSSTTYNPYDSVKSGSNFYICILESTNNEPPNATYWTQITTGVGIGQPFQLSRSTAGDEFVEFSFNEVIRLVGGGLNRANGAMGDYIDFRIYAPATPVKSVSGTGNVIRTEIDTGLYRYDPGSNTDYEIDVRTAVPVPNANNTGKWDYDLVNCEVYANGSSTGKYDLYSFANQLVEHVHAGGLMGDGDVCMTLPAVTPKTGLPQWRHKVTIHNEGGSHDLKVVWRLAMGRVRTIDFLLGA